MDALNFEGLEDCYVGGESEGRSGGEAGFQIMKGKGELGFRF